MVSVFAVIDCLPKVAKLTSAGRATWRNCSSCTKLDKGLGSLFFNQTEYLFRWRLCQPSAYTVQQPNTCTHIYSIHLSMPWHHSSHRTIFAFSWEISVYVKFKNKTWPASDTICCWAYADKMATVRACYNWRRNWLCDWWYALGGIAAIDLICCKHLFCQ